MEDCKEALGKILSSRLTLWVADVDFKFAFDSHREMYDTKGGFSEGGAILVRPDQHILGCISPDASASDIVTLIADHVGI